LLADFGRRVNARVVANGFVNEGGGRGVAVRELHVVGDRGDHFRTQQVVDELVGLVDVLGVGRNGQHVEEAGSAFLRNAVGDGHAVLAFFGTGLGLLQVAGVADRDADVTGGQLADVFRGVEVGDRRA